MKPSSIDYFKVSTISYFTTPEDYSSSNTLYIFPKIIYLESIVFINDEIPVLDDINGYNYTHKTLSEVIGCACYDSDMNSDNTKG